MHTKNLKNALELRRDFTQNLEINQIYKFRKSYRFRERNPNLEVIMKCKFCSGTHNKGSSPAYGKIAIIVEIRVILLNGALKRKAFIH